MRQAIEQQAEGYFEYEPEKLNIEVGRLELSLGENQAREGFFQVVSAGGRAVTGYVGSSNIKMQCLTTEFDASQAQIQYRFDAMGIEAGKVLEGRIFIVSSAGEYKIPFTVTIENAIQETTLGDIKDLFQFTNLARMNWKEAVKVFYSKEFITIFKNNDARYLNQYLGLSKNGLSEMNVDEFLVAINKKQFVTFQIEQDSYQFENISENFTQEISITSQGWGYVRLSLESDTPFIKIQEKFLGEEDFINQKSTVLCTIKADKLHKGRNYGKVRLYNQYQTIEVEILIRHKSDEGKVKVNREIRKQAEKLMRLYMEFRMKKIQSSVWIRESGKIVERMCSLDGNNIEARLFHAQLLMVENRFNEVAWMLKHVETDMKIKSASVEHYCYYLYLTTLQIREEEYVDHVVEIVKGKYQENPLSWKLLWVLLYLDEELNHNLGKKLASIENQFDRGTRSPILYIEAYNILAANPALLSKLGEFELKLMTWVMKHKLYHGELIKQLLFLSGRVKSYSDELLRILIRAYEYSDSEESVSAICTFLIKGSKTEEEYFKWYELGVKKELRITRLYDYFMYTIPHSYRALLPKTVLMYFAYSSNLDNEKNAFLYANVLRHTDEMPEMIRSYQKQIEQFVEDRLRNNDLNEDLAYLYKQILIKERLSDEQAGHLAQILFTQKLTLHKDIYKQIVVIHNQLITEMLFPVLNKIAYIQSYNDDFEVLFQDVEGNRHVPDEEEYEIELVLEDDELTRAVSKIVTDNIAICLHMSQGKKHYIAITHENAPFCQCLLNSPIIRESFKQRIRIDLANYYYEHDRMKNLDGLIESCDMNILNVDDRAQMIQYMITRGMYQKAIENIEKYSPEKISPKILVRLCSRVIVTNENEEDKKLLDICHFAFRHGKYDQVTLTYLADYLEAPTKELRDIWKATIIFQIDSYILCERIITQMLFSNEFIGEKGEIFASYLQAGPRRTVEMAYFSCCAYGYFVKDVLIEEETLCYLVKEYYQGEVLNTVCMLAVIKYYAENPKVYDAGEQKMLVEFITALLDKNIYFRIFQKFLGCVPALEVYAERTIIEYKTNPKTRVFLYYLLEEEEQEEQKEQERIQRYVREEMQHVYEDGFSKEFLLFFGEKLQYYITEERDGEEQITESSVVTNNDIAAAHKETRYDMINYMEISVKLKDDDSFYAAMKKYLRNDFAVSKLFTIKS